ncbi:MAG: 1-phosphofructokinase family hexose kinase [Actinomycetota bacterium]
MLIAGPNLTTDRTLTIEELRPGEVLRFSTAIVTPGGKGVNVARVARALGFPATLVAVAPGRTGRAVVELLGDEGLDVVPVQSGGEVRAASVILEESGRVTVLNEPGPALAERDWEAYERAVATNLSGNGFLVCIGSLPPSSPPDACARLVRVARARDVRALVDAMGAQLAAALEARPDLATPNLAEAEGVLLGTESQPVDDGSLEVRPRALDAASELVARGAGTAVVTAGAAGVAVATASVRRWVEAPKVEVRNPIGAGDSLVAGLVGTLERGGDLDRAVLIGVAAAAASVETEVAGVVDPERVRALAAKLDS